ncbi:MAG: hypothetical protein GY832_25160 [Chloroflexi bacterium]|nr:hypothetical protein [Chloroflexota bacterium]
MKKKQLVRTLLGEIPEEITFSLKRNDAIVEGIMAEVTQRADKADYDLITIGALEEWFLRNLLFRFYPRPSSRGNRLLSAHGPQVRTSARLPAAKADQET